MNDTASITAEIDGRLLNNAEREMVALTIPPSISAMSADELQALGKRLRQARDRYRRISSRQKREIRGKAEPRGAVPTRENAGSEEKVAALVAALKRVTQALRRARLPRHVQVAREALAAKQAAPPPAHPNAGYPSGGRTGAKTVSPAKASSRRTVVMDPREIGRVSKATKVAQARRDK